MAFQVSPGVNVSEIDLSTSIANPSVSDAAIACSFAKGPVNEVTTVTSEKELVEIFGEPDDNNASNWFAAASFLAYAGSLQVINTLDTTNAKNAVDTGTAPATADVGSPSLYDDAAASVFSTAAANWIAKAGGALSNSVGVSLVGSGNGFSQSINDAHDNASAAIGETAVTVADSTAFQVGDLITFGEVGGDEDTLNVYRIIALPDGQTITIKPKDGQIGEGLRKAPADDDDINRKWQFSDLFDSGPTSTQFVIDASGNTSAADEIHVVVYDADGGISGKKDTDLEVFGNVSLAADAVNEKGESNFIGDVLRHKSNYIYYGKSELDGITKTGDLASTFGTAATFTGDLPTVYRLANGAGTATQNNSDAARQLGYDLLADADTYDVSLLIMGESTSTLAKYVHDNIASVRKDCVVFFSPELADVNGKATDSAKAKAVTDFRDSVNINSSYAVMDSGWKRVYDKYNDKYRDVPLNGDVAGTCVRTDNTRDPLYSPAGFDRGQIKNVVKLHFNPQKAHRDTLYKKGVNPVVNFPGQGIVLYGDKTQLTKPSAFDRINVRRLFIVLEKAIARASKYSLFEFNDEFTRAQFRNMVEPFLRDVKSRRGIHDYKVVCDDSNNTSEVIDRNEFIGDIFIKPARSINFIQLNFVAVRTGVDFSEVVGAV